ncbi:MAG: hypothetical protein KKB20_30415 [Proteobacteria bacterium]|nr:hypothetical protein [Pseudomonadota bacterium]
MKIGRIGASAKINAAPERRADDRRAGKDDELIAVHRAFDRFERIVFKVADRRRLIRRDVDVQQAIARLE